MSTLIKPKQTIPEIANAAANVLSVWLPDLLDINNSSRRITEQRYMVFALMEKAGYTHQQIADYFKMNRESITKALTKLEAWLPLYSGLRGTYTRLEVLALKEV